MKPILLVSCIIFVTGCESDVDKLERLRGKQVVACLLAERQDDIVDSLRSTDTVKYTAALSEWSKGKAECELATRSYEAVGR